VALILWLKLNGVSDAAWATLESEESRHEAASLLSCALE
jgi:hypothetical protein